MEVIQIKDGKDKIVLYLEGNKITGKRFKPDNTIEAIDKSVLNYFDVFQLSNNRTPLDNEGEYQVVLDKNTNFKHYFKDGVEDFMMFFYNNGEDATCYMKDEQKKSGGVVKAFAIGTIIITIALTTFAKLTGKKPENFDVNVPGQHELVATPAISVDWIKDAINKSNGLTEFQKELLVNNDKFFEKALARINTSEYLKENLRTRLNNFTISEYPSKAHPGWWGYYTGSNTAYISEACFEDANVVMDEFMHVFQPNMNYYLLRQNIAKKLSHDLRGEKLYMSERDKTVQLTENLAKIIGIDTLLDYNFLGDDSIIENAVKPYLTDEQFEDFKKGFLTYPDEEMIGKLDHIINVVMAGKKGLCVEPWNRPNLDPIVDETNCVVGYHAEGDAQELLETCRPTRVKDALDAGLIKIWKYDQNGNLLGEATYEDTLTNFPYNMNREPFHFEIEVLKGNYSFAGIGISTYDNGGTTEPYSLLHPWPRDVMDISFLDDYPKEKKILSFDEVGPDFKPRVYTDDLPLEFKGETPVNTKTKFEYSNGCYAEVLDDNKVLWRDQNGNEKVFGLPEYATLKPHDDGFIVWTLKEGNAYRAITPDGILSEAFLVVDSEYPYEDDRRYVYRTSTGAEINFCDFSPDSYKTADGKLRYTTDERVFEPYMKDGKQVGTIVYDRATIGILDNEGKTKSFTKFDMDGEDAYAMREEEKDGIITLKFTNGTIEYQDENNKLLGYDYPNGYSIKVTDEKKFDFYDPSGNCFYSKTLGEYEDWGYISGGRTSLDFQDMMSGYDVSIFLGHYCVEEPHRYDAGDTDIPIKDLATGREFTSGEAAAPQKAPQKKID